MRPFTALAIVALLPFLIAADPPPVPTTIPTLTFSSPRLTIQNADPAARKPLRISKADFHVVLTGYLAETSFTLTFQNDSDQILEGQLEFPLPDNVVICGYALDIGGIMVDGVAVEKQRARSIFETEVHKRIDPGLVEQTDRHSFLTRVYPIPANGTRTVRLQYVNDLSLAKDAATYTLPLDWKQTIPDLTITVEAVKPPGLPLLTGLPNMSFVPTPDDQHLIAKQQLHNIELSGSLTMTIPHPRPSQALVENRVVSTETIESLSKKIAPAERSEYYFALTDRPPIDRRPAPADKPARIELIWDASLARATTDKKPELALLKDLLQSIGNTTVDLVVFRNVVEPPVSFNIRQGNAADLLAYLEKLPYDGAADLSAVPLVRNPADLALANAKPQKLDDYPYILLFTSGLNPLGSQAPAATPIPLYAISNDPHADDILLKHIANASKGAYVDLQHAAPADALAAIQGTAFTLLSLTFDPAQITEVYPAGPQAVLGQITLSGKLLAPSAKITLNYGYGGTITQQQTVTLDQATATHTGLVPRFWAQQKLAELLTAPNNNPAILALGRDFNLVTPATSLLVLETLNQYINYGVLPPKSRSDIYQPFVDQIAQMPPRANDGSAQALWPPDQSKIPEVLAAWQARVTWWNDKFVIPPGFHYIVPLDVPAASMVRFRANWYGPSMRVPTGIHPVPTDWGDLLPVFGLKRIGHPGEEPMGGISGGVAGTTGGGGRSYFSDSGGAAGGLFTDTAGGSGGLRVRVIDDLNTTPNNTPPAPPRADDIIVSHITVPAKDPQAPYLTAMRAADPANAYDVYLAQRPKYLTSPDFYMDCADHLLARKQTAQAVRVLTDIAAIHIDDPSLLRLAAVRLQDAGQFDLAIKLFEKVLQLLPDEPQPHRDLAIALIARGQYARQQALERQHKTSPLDIDPHLGQPDFQRALQLLHKVVMTHWPRQDELGIPALMEANDLWAYLQRAKADTLLTNPFDPRLLKNLDLDLRVILSSDTENMNVGLCVTESTGEKCSAANNRTIIGGLFSCDSFGRGQPNEYCLHIAQPGLYKIQADYNYYSTPPVAGPVTLQATIITNFGRPNEKRQFHTLRLTNPYDTVNLGTVTIGH